MPIFAFAFKIGPSGVYALCVAKHSGQNVFGTQIFIGQEMGGPPGRVSALLGTAYKLILT